MLKLFQETLFSQLIHLIQQLLFKVLEVELKLNFFFIDLLFNLYLIRLISLRYKDLFAMKSRGNLAANHELK